MVNKKKCVLCEQESSKNVTLFSFPLTMRESWAEFCSIPSELLPTRALLCSQHFSSDQFKISSQLGAGRRLSLKQNAVPSLRSTPGTACAETTPMRHFDKMKSDKVRKYQAASNKKYRFCCICGNVAVNERFKTQFHCFPRDETFRNTWLESLQLTEYKAWFRICQRHFKEGNPDNLPTRALIFEGKKNDYEEENPDNVPESAPIFEEPDSTKDNSELIRLNATPPMLNRSNADRITSSANSVTETERLTSACTDSERNDDCVMTESNELIVSVPSETGNTPTTPVSGSRRKPFRHFADFSTPDLDTPRRKRRCLELGRSQIIQYRRKIDALKHQKARLEKRVVSLEEALDNALNRKHTLSDRAVICCDD